MKNSRIKSYDVILHALDKEFNFPTYREQNLKTNFTKKLKNFTSELKIITPIGYQKEFPIKDINIKISPEDKSVFEHTSLDDGLLVRAHGQNHRAEKIKNYFWQSYYHIGRFNNQYAFYPGKTDLNEVYQKTNGGYKLNYSLNILGFEAKTFYSQVMPSYTSYSEIFIVPHIPETLRTKRRNKKRQPIVAVIKLLTKGKSLYKVLSMTQNFKIEENIIEESQHKSFCSVGFVGEPTKDKFSHSRKAGLSKTDYTLLKTDIIRRNGKLGNETFKVITTMGQSVDVPAGMYLWRKYALNQNLYFKQFNEKVFNTKMLFKNIGLTLYPKNNFTPGTPLEILGRHTVGFKDKISGIGRRCTPEEKDNKISSCKRRSIDRYLVTSPSIRQTDGIQKFSEITHNKGIRWINVVDVDMLKDNQSIYYTNPGHGNLLFKNSCPKDSENKFLSTHSYYTKYYKKYSEKLEKIFTPIINYIVDFDYYKVE